jgi:hypothetical protein
VDGETGDLYRRQEINTELREGNRTKQHNARIEHERGDRAGDGDLGKGHGGLCFLRPHSTRNSWEGQGLRRQLPGGKIGAQNRIECLASRIIGLVRYIDVEDLSSLVFYSESSCALITEDCVVIASTPRS